ncbi:MAG: energy transducer TonB [Longimicrobiaceae bacterium]
MTPPWFPRPPRAVRFPRWMRRAPALALLLACAAAPLAAQAPDSSARWKPVLTGADGTVLAIDSVTVDRTGDSTFIVRTALRFPRRIALASGDTVDREVDTEELNCRGDSTRPLLSQEYDGEELVAMTILPKKWGPVAPGRRAVFDASCAWLLGGFAAGLRRSYWSEDVEEQPELVNRAAVSGALSREYPPQLRASGQTGTVLLRFRVMEDGKADRRTVSVEQVSHPDFADAAVRVVYAMRFRPARLNRRPVPVWVTLPVTFRLFDGPGTLPPGSPPPLPPIPQMPRPPVRP